MIDYYELKLDVTLSGCGFLGSYHVGALCLLQQIWPRGHTIEYVAPLAAGGLIGTLILAGVKTEDALDCAMDVIRQLRGFIRNPTLIRTASIASLVEQKLEHLLPKNAHELCSGRLGISLTKIWSFENKFVSEFESRQDLIDACKASCFIPGWSGSLRPQEYKGEQYIDGGFSDNRPRFPNEKEEDGDNNSDDDLAKKNATRHILISGIAIEADVTPRDDGALFKARIFGNVYLATWKNVMRCIYAIIPTSLERYKDDLVGGYIDMKEYLFRNDLLKCRDCWHKAAPDNGTAMIKKEACIACLKVLEQVDSLSMPKSLFDAYKE